MNTLEKFSVPQKNEKWRFSGLKEVALANLADAGDASSFKASLEVKVTSGKALSANDRKEIGQSFTDMGSLSLDQMGPQVYGAKVHAPKGVSGEAHLYANILDEHALYRGRTLTQVDENAQLTVIENVGSQRNHNAFVLGQRLQVARGGQLRYILLQDAPSESHLFQFFDIQAAADANVEVILINLGRGYVRQELTARMTGAGANVQLRSLSLATGTQEIDQRTLQIHEAPNAKSDLLFKNILAGKARTVFSGLIRVAPGAQKTDAYQKNRNLLLSDEAHANSLPGLEIEANDVRCTHGATCGRLSEQELFYLRSRGVDERDAQRLLVAGSAEEIWQNLPEEALEWARQKLEARLG